MKKSIFVYIILFLSISSLSGISVFSQKRHNKSDIPDNKTIIDEQKRLNDPESNTNKDKQKRIVPYKNPIIDNQIQFNIPGNDPVVVSNDSSIKKFPLADTLTVKLIQESIYDIELRNEAYEWQYFSSKFIFWLVMSLVVMGTIFSGIHFFKSEKQILSKDTKDGTNQQKEDTATDIEVGPTSLKLHSSLVGVIILIVSFLFLYLYLVQVYPIK